MSISKMKVPYNALVLLGPTATGKTKLACLICAIFGAQIISCDSRQVYKGLDIGSGKDMSEYEGVISPQGQKVKIKTHLIDITDLYHEYNLFDFQKDCLCAIDKVRQEGNIPFLVGGTGLYLSCIIQGYDLTPVPENIELRKHLENFSQEELVKLLGDLNPLHHNTSDFHVRERTVRAIEIQTYKRQHPKENTAKKNDFFPLIMGVTLPREELRSNIKKRLQKRFKEGMIEEARGLLQQGFCHQRLERLGLEYKFLSLYLKGEIPTFEQLFERLFVAICQFAKRQETWFRGMQKKGIEIHWLPSTMDDDVRLASATKLLQD